MNVRYLTRPKAAEYLTDRGFPVTKGTLQKWASTGGGPPYRVFGNRSLYTPPELDEWAESKLSQPRGGSSHVTVEQ